MAKKQKNTQADEQLPVKDTVEAQLQPSASTEAVKELAPEDLVSKVPINKYDPFQLKSSIDDEICYVSKDTRISGIVT